MKKKTYTVTVNGKQIQVPVKINKKLASKITPNVATPAKSKKSSLKKKIATTALVLAIGAGAIIGGHALMNHINKAPETPAVVQQADEVKEGLRFDPNSKENLIDNAVFLIEDAAKTGKEISPEDAVLCSVVANSDELKPWFMGKLFGEAKDQEYTYGQLVDAYLRVAMMNVENMSLSKTDDLAFNTESIFASEEDYNYLNNIRTLSTRFNTSTDEAEKKQIADELNKIAFELCTYETYDISSAAGTLSMLYLDGMRLITNTNDIYTVLPNDIRDEMFGDGEYGCRTEATFKSGDQVLPTHYSYRVNDLKLDSVQAKLKNAVLEDGETVILDEIIRTVEERTKDVVITDINAVDAINEEMEDNRNVLYEYEQSKGEDKSNYSPKTDSDQTTRVDGKDVIINNDNTNKPTNDKTQSQAQQEVNDQAAKEQAEADRGSAAGKHDGENGLPKANLSGKSQTYIDTYNMSYDAYKAIYDAKHSTEKDELISEKEVSTSQYQQNSSVETSSTIVSVETQAPTTTHSQDELVSERYISLDDLTPEQLQELRDAAVGEEIIVSGKTK